MLLVYSYLGNLIHVNQEPFCTNSPVQRTYHLAEPRNVVRKGTDRQTRRTNKDPQPQPKLLDQLKTACNSENKRQIQKKREKKRKENRAAFRTLCRGQGPTPPIAILAGHTVL